MRKTILASMLLILANAFVFGQVYTFDFVGYDDAELVLENPALQYGLTAEGVRVAFAPYYANWIPLTTMSYLVDHAVHGLEAGGYHLTNLAFHIVNCVLVFLVFRYLTGQFWASLGLALLFTLHPTRVETVAWISERKGLVSTTFMLGAIWAYAGYVRSSGKLLYAATVLLLILSLMAKSVAVTLPFVFLLLDVWPLNRYSLTDMFSRDSRSKFVRLCIEKTPFFLIVIVSGLITIASQGESGSVSTLTDVTIWMRLTNTFYGYGAYLVHTIWPIDLIPFYPHLGEALPLWKPMAGLSIVSVTTILVLMQLRRRPYLFVGWFWFAGMLVPAIGLVQVGAQAYADRYMYVPLLGLGIMIFGAMAEWAETRPGRVRGAAASCAIVLAGFAWISWMTTSHWRNTVQLFSYVVEVDDENLVGHTILGMALLQEDELDESQLHLERALALDANHPPALYALGTLYLRQADPGATSADADAMAAGSETYDKLENNIGASYIMREEYGRAEVHLLKALELNPGNAVAMTNLAIVRHAQGRVEEALGLAEDAAMLDPSYVNAREFADYIKGE
jgi:Flp pilus assembly protein TadD